MSTKYNIDMADTRIYAYAIYEILKKYSDENNILSNPQIINLLKTKYDIEVNNRTVVSNIESLINFGVDISTYLENRKGYFLRERDFDDYEIQLLCNIIHSSHFIPTKASDDLIDRLSKTQSRYKEKDFRNKVYMDHPRKTKNNQILLNISTLLEAIKEHRNISMTYLTYNMQKELVNKREDPYILSPHHIIEQNDNLYLMITYPDDEIKEIKYYRIDKMKDIKILDDKYDPLKINFDPYQFAKKTNFMYSGDSEKITLRCNKKILNDVIDKLGYSIKIHEDPLDTNYFHLIVDSNPDSMKYFSLQYLQYCEILSPAYLREEVKEILENKLQEYKR